MIAFSEVRGSSDRGLSALMLQHDVLNSHMARIQIQLTVQQARRLRAEARERGLSLAEITRRYVEKGLSEETRNRAALYERAARVVGRFRDRRWGRDLSSKHELSRRGVRVNAVQT